MSHSSTRKITTVVVAAALMVLATVVLVRTLRVPDRASSLIVQADEVATAAAWVHRVGGRLTHELAIINAVGADLTQAQIEQLRDFGAPIKLHQNHVARVAGGAVDTYYPTLVGADALHRAGIDGYGVTVAIIDTGLWSSGTSPKQLKRNIYNDWRVLAGYDAINGVPYQSASHTDDHGHGSHVASILASSAESTSAGSYNGIAPNIDWVYVKAFDENGQGTYLDVIRGIDYIVANKDVHGIRVLNLSFSAEPRSHYWDDPLNQAVMAAWNAGIVVVTSAGNRGPDAMTIGSPGNVPYVITVGAMTDSYTPNNGTDDVLAPAA